MKTEAYKLYSRVFGIFLPNVIVIDPYNFELYRFKVGAFFWRHSVVLWQWDVDCWCIVCVCLCACSTIEHLLPLFLTQLKDECP